MVSPLEGSIRRTIGKAMASIFFPVTIIRTVPGDGPVWDPGPSVDVEYRCKGFVDTYSDFYLATGNVLSSDRKIVVLTDTLTISPEIGDRVRARGQTFSVLNVATDPAEATWTLQART